MRILATVILLLLFIIPLFGQIVDNRSAETVVREYNAASLKQDWTGMASLLHPDSLKEFRSMFALLLEKNPTMANSVFGIKSKADFAVLSDSQVFEKLFGFISSSSPEMEALMKSMEVIVIGSVEEHPDLRHFVHRTNFKLGTTPISHVDVYSLKRVQNTWRVLMKDDEIRAMAAALEKLKPTTPVKKAAPVKTKKRVGAE